LRLLTPTGNKRFNELIGFLCITLAVLIALALLSYSPKDASFNVSAAAIDGSPARACLTLAAQIDGCEVRTVESLAPSAGRLGILQAAFKRNHALQCGFCTAGILMSCADYLKRVPDPTETQVREMLSGHLCRCTGYTPIVAAVLDVAALRNKINESIKKEPEHA